MIVAAGRVPVSFLSISSRPEDSIFASRRRESGSFIYLDLSTQQSTKTNATSDLSGVPIKIRTDNVDAEYFQNIFEPCKSFNIVVAAVYIECIGAGNKVPVQTFKQGDLISEKSIEVVFRVCGCIEAVVLFA